MTDNSVDWSDDVAASDDLNRDVPDDGFGVPIDPELRDLRYQYRGMHLRPIAERLKHEDDMNYWIAVGESYGFDREQSMLFGLYL